MSRHTALTGGLGKLKLEDSVSPSSQKRGLSGKSSSSSSGRKSAASHATSSLLGSRSSRTPSTSGAHASAGHSGREVRPSTINQRGNNDGGRGDEDDSDEDESDVTSDSDDPGDQINAILENNLRIAELMACGTDNNLTSVQILPSTSDTPEGLSPVTAYLSQFAQNFAAAQFSTNQPIVNNLMNGIPRDPLITRNIENFWIQIQRIFQELRNHINDPSGGRNVNGTVTEITKWQSALRRFVYAYQGRSWLTNDQRTNLYSLAIWTIHTIIERNREDESGVFHTGDLHPGNLYQKWRISGDPKVLFWTLGQLRDRNNALSAQYRNLLVYDRARLQEWREGPTGEEALANGPIVSVLMEAAC